MMKYRKEQKFLNELERKERELKDRLKYAQRLSVGLLRRTRRQTPAWRPESTSRSTS